jgi:regulatory protein
MVWVMAGETHFGSKRRGREAKRTRRRRPLKATAESLEAAALAYLERYAAPAAHLSRVLLVKVERSARFHGTDREAGAAAVETIVRGLVERGLVDDALYAEARTRSLRRRGASGRAIRGQLAVKGVAPDLVERALDRLDRDLSDPELAAALAYARRRRIGPYRTPAERATSRNRDLAALGRQGFDYDTARRVVDADDLEDLEQAAAALPE